MAFVASALQSQQDDELQNERNVAELSVRGSWKGTDSFVYYRSRYLEEILQCVQGTINRAYIGMRFAYDGDFHIQIHPCEVEVSVASGEAVLSLRYRACKIASSTSRGYCVFQSGYQNVSPPCLTGYLKYRAPSNSQFSWIHFKAVQRFKYIKWYKKSLNDNFKRFCSWGRKNKRYNWIKLQKAMIKTWDNKIRLVPEIAPCLRGKWKQQLTWQKEVHIFTLNSGQTEWMMNIKGFCCKILNKSSWKALKQSKKQL